MTIHPWSIYPSSKFQCWTRVSIVELPFPSFFFPLLPFFRSFSIYLFSLHFFLPFDSFLSVCLSLCLPLRLAFRLSCSFVFLFFLMSAISSHTRPFSPTIIHYWNVDKSYSIPVENISLYMCVCVCVIHLHLMMSQFSRLIDITVKMQ